MNDCTIHEIENIIHDFRFEFDWSDKFIVLVFVEVLKRVHLKLI